MSLKKSVGKKIAEKALELSLDFTQRKLDADAKADEKRQHDSDEAKSRAPGSKKFEESKMNGSTAHITRKGQKWQKPNAPTQPGAVTTAAKSPPAPENGGSASEAPAGETETEGDHHRTETEGADGSRGTELAVEDQTLARLRAELAAKSAELEDARKQLAETQEQLVALNHRLNQQQQQPQPLPEPRVETKSSKFDHSENEVGFCVVFDSLVGAFDRSAFKSRCGGWNRWFRP